MLKADFTAKTTRCAASVQLWELVEGRRVSILSREVENKSAARKLAGLYNAQCWNF